MTATEVRPEVSPPAESALCRVCGETVNPRQTHCPRCGNSTKTPLPNPLDSTWVDAVLATLCGLTTIAISLPTTFWLSEDLWDGAFERDDMLAAALITSVNTWLIGVPVMVTLLRWRNRIQDDEHFHSAAIRDYWQIQSQCLIPPALVLIPLFTLYIVFKYF